MLGGEVSEIVLLDVTPLSLGIETTGGVFTKPVEKEHHNPHPISLKTFSTAEDNQTNVDVQVFQGERPIARDNKLLGNFMLDGIAPGRRGMAKSKCPLISTPTVSSRSQPKTKPLAKYKKSQSQHLLT
ncbi:MAG: Hsp70 family protein [Candidatus Obscuribacter sp.]|nr:Hsp70 family protein [Candidatus Obscuribacter sp.]